jgi:regulator of sirC expression with transglutaminase-like and TPR domain
MPTAADWRRAFARSVHIGRRTIELDRVALIIAAEERPELDVAHYQRELDQIAERVGDELGDELDPYLIVGTLNRVLFKTLGFRGNLSEYYDPRNSRLDQVIERRLGIPITLSIVYLEVARRLQLPVVGVGFPGHFLISYQAGEDSLLVDCFRGGEIVLPGDYQARLDEIFEGKLRFRRAFLRPTSPRAVIARLLTNLKAIFWRLEDHRRALAVSERLILVNPNAAEEYRDRGLLHYCLHDAASALPDLEHYLTLAPKAPDAEGVRLLARTLRGGSRHR